MKVWTDGACSIQLEGCPGGWGAVCVSEKLGTIELSGYEMETTNNRMEMKAFLAGLKTLVESDEFEKVIHTDSAYISNCFAQKWYVNWQKNGWVNSKKEAVKNQDLWEEILEVYTSDIQIVKVKGHSGNVHNEWADRIAVYCKENQKLWEFDK